MEEGAEPRVRERERREGEMDVENGGAELAREAGLFFSTPSLTDKQRAKKVDAPTKKFTGRTVKNQRLILFIMYI